MNLLSTLLLLCSSWLAAPTDELVYQGVWNTTNRKLDGEMTCILTPIGKEEWRGRFFGVWQGVDFDYSVNFSGPANDLRGVATIDGAAYDWRGRMNERQFKANFGGDHYTGSFDLKRVSRAKAAGNSRSPQAVSGRISGPSCFWRTEFSPLIVPVADALVARAFAIDLLTILPDSCIDFRESYKSLNEPSNSLISVSRYAFSPSN